MMVSKFIKWFLLSMVVVTLTACSIKSGDIVQQTAIEKIATYAQDGVTPPTVQDYIDAGVTGVNADNLDEINAVVEGLTYEDVDTQEEIQALADKLGITLPVGVKKTGQTTVYYSQDDGFYQAGLEPQYTRDDENNITTDHITGLEWQDDEAAKTVQKIWEEAKTYCSSLPLGGGGWRLPTVVELQSIVVDGAYNPSIDTTAFLNYTTSNYYWSSATTASNSSYAWIVNFGNGHTSYYNKDSSNSNVRCVRAGQ